MQNCYSNQECISNIELETDAVNNDSELTVKSKLSNIKLFSISKIENELEEYEKVSLSFLLLDNIYDYYIYDYSNSLKLYEWAEKESSFNPNWQEKLLEGLSIIKNYQIPKSYGFTKEELIKEYFPHLYFTTKSINKFRKIIYCVCEQLTQNEENSFLKAVENDFKRKNINFIKYPQLELNFLHFLKNGYITQTNVENCSKIFKSQELEHICDMLKYIQQEVIVSGNIVNNKECIVNKIYRNISADDTNLLSEEDSTNIPSTSTFRDSNEERPSNLDNRLSYDLSKNRICMIIDQENFYTEIDEKYQHLLPADIETNQLSRRDGTYFDSQRLEESFGKKKFQVVTKKNLTHLGIIEELEKLVFSIDEKECSCLFVVLLSHGDEGIIYGSNSCYVEVSSIIDVMCSKKFKNIPKVLIIQSCQGQNLQTMSNENNNLDTDGNRLHSLHKRYLKDPHVLIFWSTVRGFASIRNKQTGTWFIQSLCNQLDKADDEDHFQDITLKIKDEVISQKWKKDNNTESYMVPYDENTLAAKLYLNK